MRVLSTATAVLAFDRTTVTGSSAFQVLVPSSGSRKTVAAPRRSFATRPSPWAVPSVRYIHLPVCVFWIWLKLVAVWGGRDRETRWCPSRKAAIVQHGCHCVLLFHKSQPSLLKSLTTFKHKHTRLLPDPARQHKKERNSVATAQAAAPCCLSLRLLLSWGGLTSAHPGSQKAGSLVDAISAVGEALHAE